MLSVGRRLVPHLR